MSRLIVSLAVAVYALLAAAALLWWAPHYLSVNTHIPLNTGYRYLAASGVPFGLMLVTVAARQSQEQSFSLALLLEVLVAGGLLACALYAFYFPPQAVFFSAMHLLAVVVFTITNLYRYRRTIQMRERYAEAD